MKPRLTKLILKNVTFSSSIEFWGFTSRELMCLRHLELEDVMISSDAINLFWDTCTRLQTIRLQSIDLPEGPEKFLLFPDITYLSLSRLCNITEQGFHQWVSRCPSLKSLLFRQITRIPSAICSSHVIRENWPMLESLGISGSQLSDYELSQILYGMKTVKDLRALNTGFGPISFGAMKPHLKDLRELSASSHTQDPGPIDSTMMHEIMVSCPELDVLDGVHAIAEDLLAYDAPWIAIRLTSLNLAIGFPLDCDPSLQIAMFKQLSRLKSLETLSLHEAEGYSSFDFRLSRGMGQLKSLTKLREISLGNTIQQMEKEDVQWLIENMGSLSVLKGKLNQDPEKSREFGSLSTSRHTISSY
ncbi:hypothetical protein BGZ49_010657 [Haplosporangium sp. Z 27]|nr:hypothetical protein BGZ49_010657 [Haplosporangium sp. Z 27]